MNDELLGLAERQRDVFLLLGLMVVNRASGQNLAGRFLAGIGMGDAGDEQGNGTIQFAAAKGVLGLLGQFKELEAIVDVGAALGNTRGQFLGLHAAIQQPPILAGLLDVGQVFTLQVFDGLQFEGLAVG